MPKRASVTLRGPRGPGEKLYLSGFCPAVALESGPLRLQAGIDGEKLRGVRIRKPDAAFWFAFELPSHLIGRSKVEVTVGLDVPFLRPGTRENWEFHLAYSRFDSDETSPGYAELHLF